MAFPTTSILDTFNRADQGPPPSASWSSPIISGLGGLKVVSNQLVANGGNGDAYWNVATFGPDSECYITIGTLGNGFGLYLRGAQPGTGGFDGYYLDIYSGSIDIYRMDNDSYSYLSSISTTTNSGDAFGADMVGDLLTVYRKPSGGAWGSIGTQTDATYAGAGYIGVLVGSTCALDDFGGGTISGGSFNPTQTVTETGSGADTDSGVRLATIAETATGADANTSVRLATIAETGSGADASSGVRLTTIADTSTGVDGTSGVGAGTSTETGSGADAAAGQFAATVADSATGTDAVSTSGSGAASSSDTSTGTDATAGAVASLSADSASANDLPSGLIVIAVADVAHAVDHTSAGGTVIIGARATLSRDAKAQAALAQRRHPHALIARALPTATIAQRIKPIAAITHQTKPSAAIASV